MNAFCHSEPYQEGQVIWTTQMFFYITFRNLDVQVKPFLSAFILMKLKIVAGTVNAPNPPGLYLDCESNICSVTTVLCDCLTRMSDLGHTAAAWTSQHRRLPFCGIRYFTIYKIHSQQAQSRTWRFFQSGIFYALRIFCIMTNRNIAFWSSEIGTP